MTSRTVFGPGGRILTLTPIVEPAKASERRVHAAAARFASLLPREGSVPGGSVKMSGPG